MSEPFLAEIRIVGFNFAPRGWAFCDGQILPINQNQSLYSLMGTTYGGDGRTTFALPDLRGRVPVHVGQSTGSPFTQGQKGGQETHTLTTSEIPEHTHVAFGTESDQGSGIPSNQVLASAAENAYHSFAAANKQALAPTTLLPVGGQAHNNMQPVQVLNFCIALQGLFPSRN